MMLAYNLFMKYDTPVRHNEKPRHLVTEGIYRYSRNPMYVAGGLIFLGIATLLGTWPFFLAWAAMGLVLDQVFIPWEEKGMEQLFGEDYVNYKKSIRRWI